MNPQTPLSASTPHEVTTRITELCNEHDDPRAVATHASTALRTLDLTMSSIQHGTPAARRLAAQRLAPVADEIGARELGNWCRVLMLADDPQAALTSNARAEADTVADLIRLHLPALEAGNAPAETTARSPQSLAA